MMKMNLLWVLSIISCISNAAQPDFEEKIPVICRCCGHQIRSFNIPTNKYRRFSLPSAQLSAARVALALPIVKSSSQDSIAISSPHRAIVYRPTKVEGRFWVIL